MATYKCSGIVIKRSNLGEADRILTIFTDKFGKIKAVAKGVRKTLSKLSGFLELFCVDDLLLAEGRSLDTVAGAVTTKCFKNLRGNLKATQTAFYFAEIIDKLTEDREPHKEIFELLENSLEHLDGKKNDLLISYFEFNFLAETGFHPELNKCISCSKKLEEAGNFFSFESGGLMCKNCRHDIGHSISSEAIKVLRLFLQHRISVIDKLKTENNLSKEIRQITRGYLKHTSGKELKSEGYLYE